MLPIDDDRAGAVELELASKEIRTRHAGDLHDESSGLQSPPLPVGMPDDGHRLEPVAAVEGFQLPSGEVLDARLLANLLDDVVACREGLRERWTNVTLEPSRASSSASSVRAVAAADHDDVTPDEPIRPRFELIGDVTSEGAVRRGRQLLATWCRSRSPMPALGCAPHRLRSIAHRGRRA